ncbi:hypothetical protein CTAYLR_002914 [Chrysophaeum taylorii]|uniref:Nuclear transcription factor Y subunit n=1 Tax=Chrysophaeum taylorii TaxID=2483200 RepID=A0AAD7UMQ6_9STRA|nr:hypothetical protein CTAYLR_002914 [Chrysophaeum taylorii]
MEGDSKVRRPKKTRAISEEEEEEEEDDDDAELFRQRPSKRPSVPIAPAPPDERDEKPTYVNAKQYNRIIKRRLARAKLETLWKVSHERKLYLHESRHKHACRRKRGPGGRFLTKAELAALKEAEDAEASAASPDDTPSSEQLAATAIIAVRQGRPGPPGAAAL